ADQNIPELRKLIKTRLAKKSPNRCNSWIVPDLVNGGFGIASFLPIAFAGNKALNVITMNFRIVVCAHRSKLQALEAFSKLAQPLLREDDWPLGRQLDQQRDRQQ